MLTWTWTHCLYCSSSFFLSSFPFSYPQAKLCVHHRNWWLHFLHLWKQLPASVKWEICQEVQSKGNNWPVNSATGDRCSWQLRTGNTLNTHFSMKHFLAVARLDSREKRVAEEHWTTQEEVRGRDLSLQGGKTSRKYTRTNHGWFEEGGH